MTAKNATRRPKAAKAPRGGPQDPAAAKRLGEEIAARRDAKGWTQAQLAKAVGTSQPMIGHYECGRRAPSMRRLRELAEALEIPASELLAVALGES